ncbi:aldehyde dehydrogenase family protein [Ostertagia ostertagi]
MIALEFAGMLKEVVDRLVNSPSNEHEPLSNFIDNEFVRSKDLVPSVNPATGQAWIQIPDSTADDVNRAVAAANRAFPSWSTTSVQYRSGLLLKLADIIEENFDGLAVLESRDQGKPIKLAKSTVIDEPVRAVNYVKHDPVGVAGLISPWNLPLYLLSFKLAPALATGNTVVCKPSELTSVTAWVLMHAFQQAGFPAGVVNMVIGKGSSAGQALVDHPDVPLISFTGSTVVGKKIAETGARLNKKVSLEMGGKNAAIVYPSCDLNQHMSTIARYERLVVFQFTVGDPSKEVTLGAMNSEAHFNKVKSYVSLAKEEGGTVHCGGEIKMDGHLENGYYIAPTVITDLEDSSRCMQEEIFGPVVCVTEFESTEGYYIAPTVITDLEDSSRCMQEEIFGPVVCVTEFESTEEVVSRANATPYGLSATVWSENNKELINTAHGLRVGTVWCNTWLTRDLSMPFGGTKESGMGREGAVDSLHFFTEQKTVCIRI